QVSPRFIALSSQTVSAIAQYLLHQANIPLSSIPGTPQFSQGVPCFIVYPGDTWWSALLRLGDIYGFDTTVLTTGFIKLSERSAGDASSWSYTTEPYAIAWQTS